MYEKMVRYILGGLKNQKNHHASFLGFLFEYLASLGLNT